MLTSLVIHYERNLSGRDFAVGDIHGSFSRLETRMSEADFDMKRDRLFSVGDLVDRGPESDQALHWMAQPWFHAVRGNHEDYAIRHASTGRVDLANYRRNGGGWFIDLPPERQQEFAAAFVDLPFVMQVQTRRGPVGILHADCPVDDWFDLPIALASRRRRDQILWSRARIETGDTRRVRGVRAVIVGHTPVAEAQVLGNVVHIDTAGWSPQGHFTLLDLGHDLDTILS